MFIAAAYNILQGENGYTESVCQTIFSVHQLLEILTDERLSNAVKKPFLRYMHWAYMHTTGGRIESGTGDLQYDRYASTLSHYVRC